MDALARPRGRWEQEHGEHCDCQLLASLVSADVSAANFGFCRHVLQKRWAVRCDHGSGVPGKHVIPEFPLPGPCDAVQAILVANAIALPD